MPLQALELNDKGYKNMKNQKSKSAFTLIELVFVVVIIGILAAVAIPRLAATRDDAEITKARVLVASVRNALAMERQKRVLRGEFRPITDLGDASYAFGNFSDASGDTGVSILEYPIKNETKRYRWKRDSAAWYGFCVVDGCSNNRGRVFFKLTGGKFKCNEDQSFYAKCSMLGFDPE